MNNKKKLKDFVSCFKNKTNNQDILIPSSRKLKKFDIELEDLLNIEVKNKTKKFII